MAGWGEMSVSEGVGEGSAVGVDDRGWAELDASAGDGEVPALQVDLLVVAGAPEAAVLPSGNAAVGPVDDVVGFA
jgi:hypothetical protein